MTILNCNTSFVLESSRCRENRRLLTHLSSNNQWSDPNTRTDSNCFETHLYQFRSWLLIIRLVQLVKHLIFNKKHAVWKEDYILLLSFVSKN